MPTSIAPPPEGSHTAFSQLCSPGVNVSCLDGIEEEFSHTHALHVDEMGLEQGLRGLKALSPNFNHSPIWELQGKEGKETNGMDGCQGTPQSCGFSQGKSTLQTRASLVPQQWEGFFPTREVLP